jgi:hypothetical protein
VLVAVAVKVGVVVFDAVAVSVAVEVNVSVGFVAVGSTANLRLQADIATITAKTQTPAKPKIFLKEPSGDQDNKV